MWVSASHDGRALNLQSPLNIGCPEIFERVNGSLHFVSNFVEEFALATVPFELKTQYSIMFPKFLISISNFQYGAVINLGPNKYIDTE